MEPFGDPADTKVTRPVDSVEAIQTEGSAFQSTQGSSVPAGLLAAGESRAPQTRSSVYSSTALSTPGILETIIQSGADLQQTPAGGAVSARTPGSAEAHGRLQDTLTSAADEASGGAVQGEPSVEQLQQRRNSVFRALAVRQPGRVINNTERLVEFSIADQLFELGLTQDAVVDVLAEFDTPQKAADLIQQLQQAQQQAAQSAEQQWQRAAQQAAQARQSAAERVLRAASEARVRADVAGAADDTPREETSTQWRRVAHKLDVKCSWADAVASLQPCVNPVQRRNNR